MKALSDRRKLSKSFDLTIKRPFVDAAAATKSAADRKARSEEEVEAYRTRQTSLLKPTHMNMPLEAHSEQRRPIRRPGDISLDVEQDRSTFAFRKLAQYNATIDLDASYGNIEEKILEEKALGL